MDGETIRIPTVVPRGNRLGNIYAQMKEQAAASVSAGINTSTGDKTAQSVPASVTQPPRTRSQTAGSQGPVISQPPTTEDRAPSLSANTLNSNALPRGTGNRRRTRSQVGGSDVDGDDEVNSGVAFEIPGESPAVNAMLGSKPSSSKRRRLILRDTEDELATGTTSDIPQPLTNEVENNPSSGTALERQDQATGHPEVQQHPAESTDTLDREVARYKNSLLAHTAQNLNEKSVAVGLNEENSGDPLNQNFERISDQQMVVHHDDTNVSVSDYSWGDLVTLTFVGSDPRPPELGLMQAPLAKRPNNVDASPNGEGSASDRDQHSRLVTNQDSVVDPLTTLNALPNNADIANNENAISSAQNTAVFTGPSSSAIPPLPSKALPSSQGISLLGDARSAGPMSVDGGIAPLSVVLSNQVLPFGSHGDRSANLDLSSYSFEDLLRNQKTANELVVVKLDDFLKEHQTLLDREKQLLNENAKLAEDLRHFQSKCSALEVDLTKATTSLDSYGKYCFKDALSRAHAAATTSSQEIRKHLEQDGPPPFDSMPLS